MAPLTSKQLLQWRSRGYLALPGLLPQPLVDQAAAQASVFFSPAATVGAPQVRVHTLWVLIGNSVFVRADLTGSRRLQRASPATARFPFAASALGALNSTTLAEALLETAVQVRRTSTCSLTTHFLIQS